MPNTCQLFLLWKHILCYYFSMKTKHFFNYVILFGILLVAEILLLTATAAIPRDFIHENIKVSAEYLCEKEPFFHINHKDLASRIDRHADAILLNIAYSYDSKTPFSSAIKSAYYFDPLKNENSTLLYAVTPNVAPNYVYMRYWHGSVVFVKPLLCVMSLPQIYVLNAAVLGLLFLIAAIVLYRFYGKGACFGFVAAGIACSLWYVPLSLEYMPVFVITFSAIPLTAYIQQKHPDKIGYLFFLLGGITAYTDFLTTETLTCLIPLILLLLHHQGKQITFCLKSGLTWICCYGLTWFFKWVLYSVVYGAQGFRDALSQTAYRTAGQAASGGLFSQMSGAIIRNLRCLFPFSFLADPHGRMITVILFPALLMLFWLIRKPKNMPSFVGIFFLLGMLPYVRFVILSNHAYIHYFFTYRAQFASVFCLFLIFWYGTDTEFLRKEWKKIRHHR